LNQLPGFKNNVSLKNYTTYKIGGHAKYFFVAKTENELIKALSVAKKLKLPVFILGGGSNILVSDKGFDGLAIKIDIVDIKFNGKKVFVGAGANLTKLAYLATDKGLSGIEWAAGVPGTVGGAIYGSAQAFGTRISDVVLSVEAVNTKTLKINNFTKKQCKFSLKDSVFKKENNWVIVSAVLEFNEKEPAEIKKQIKNNLEYRRAKHPIEFPSVGSTFINPENINKNFIEKYPELKDFIKNGAVPAGCLIAKCGLAGKKVGGAQISQKHANFIINTGNASAKDVLALIYLAQKEVKKKFNIELVPEVQLIGF